MNLLYELATHRFAFSIGVVVAIVVLLVVTHLQDKRDSSEPFE